MSASAVSLYRPIGPNCGLNTPKTSVHKVTGDKIGQCVDA